MAQPNPILRPARSIAGLFALLTLALAGPVLAEPGPDANRSNASAVHATLEGAALEALAALDADRAPATRGRFRVGRILAVDGGFVWEQPSKPAAGQRPVVRLESGPDHVATFLARPTDADPHDRALAREWQRREQALVDVHDRLHRPLFVLTARGDVVVYRGAAQDDGTPIAAR